MVYGTKCEIVTASFESMLLSLCVKCC